MILMLRARLITLFRDIRRNTNYQIESNVTIIQQWRSSFNNYFMSQDRSIRSRLLSKYIINSKDKHLKNPTLKKGCSLASSIIYN